MTMWNYCDHCGCLNKITAHIVTRLRPIPEFTDTTDTDTLDLHRCRYWVPITITVVTLQPPRWVISHYYACAVSRPVLCAYVWRH